LEQHIHPYQTHQQDLYIIDN